MALADLEGNELVRALWHAEIHGFQGNYFILWEQDIKYPIPSNCRCNGATGNPLHLSLVGETAIEQVRANSFSCSGRLRLELAGHRFQFQIVMSAIP
jgi:hypothetical protein